MNVVLIGFSGTGKSTVGRVLAERLGWGFVDTDPEVERMAGKRIHRIFAEEGEPAFRRLESQAVREALRRGPRVVSVGGGAVLDATNRAAMRKGNLVVLLEAGVETIHRRLSAVAAEEPRPVLQMGVGGQGSGVGEAGGRGDAGTRGRGEDRLPLPVGEGRGEGLEAERAVPDPRARIAVVKAAREDLYRGTAHVVVETEGVGVEEVVGRILEAVSMQGWGGSCDSHTD